jgi:hypothetical protein
VTIGHLKLHLDLDLLEGRDHLPLPLIGCEAYNHAMPRTYPPHNLPPVFDRADPGTLRLEILRSAAGRTDENKLPPLMGGLVSELLGLVSPLLARIRNLFLLIFCFRQRRCQGRSRVATMFAAAAIVVPSMGTEASFCRSNFSDTYLLGAHHGGLSRLAAARKTRWNIFRNARLGIEFFYPDHQRVTIGCRASRDCVALVRKTRQSGDYLVAFEVFEGGLDTVAVDQAVFQKEGDHWVAKGRSGRYPAEPLSGPAWQGLKSTVDCGVSDSSGFHAGAGDCLWVVISNGKRSVVADTPGTVPIDQDIMRSILSIRFRAPQ